MKKIMAVALMGAVLACGAPAFADEGGSVTLDQVPTTFQKYVANPVRFLHRGTWGVVTLAFKIGKAPIDKGFELIGEIIGSDPNTPTWE